MVKDRRVVQVVNFRYRRGYTNILVGQCTDLPFIIVEGKNIEELTQKIFYEIDVYLNTFPQEAKKILKQVGEAVHVEEQQKDEGWIQKEMTVQIRT
jgi:hypothetical protein